MARLLTTGFETRLLTTSKTTNGEGQESYLEGTPTFVTENFWSGTGALKCAKATRAYYEYEGPTAAGRTYSLQTVAYADVLPSEGTNANENELIGLYNSTSGMVALGINHSGEIFLWFATAGELKNTGIFVEAAKHYIYELQIVVPTSGKGTVKVRIRNAMGVLLGEYSIEINVGTTAPAFINVGHLKSVQGDVTYYLSQLVLNDSTGEHETSWVGYQKVAMLNPVSDSSRTGFLVGAAATTNLWKGVVKRPPVGVALASKTAESQIYDATSNTTDNYHANLQSYVEAGMGEHDIVKVVMALARIADSSTTTAKVGIKALTNPEIATENTTATTITTAAATEPTGWATFVTVPAYSPTITPATGPTMLVRKGTANTNTVFVDMMAYYVSYEPVFAPNFHTAIAEGSGESPFTIPKPTGAAVGEIFVAISELYKSPEPTTPALAECTQLFSKYLATPSMQFNLFYRALTGGEGSSFSHSWGGGSLSFRSSLSFTVKGANPTTPIHKSSIATGTLTPPAITTTIANCLILVIGTEDAGEASAMPSGYTNFQYLGPGIGYAIKETAGEVKPGAFTWNSEHNPLAAIIAFAPAGSSEKHEYSVAVADTLSPSQSLVRSVTVTRQPTETLTTSDVVTRHPEFKRSPAETLSASDSVNRASTVSRKPTETLATSDTVKRATTTKRTPTESLSTSDTLTRKYNANRQVGEVRNGPLTIAEVPILDSLSRTENPLASPGWELASNFGAENIGQATPTGWTGTTASKIAGAKRKTWVTGQTGFVAITVPVLPSEAQVINLGFIYGPTCYLYVYGDNEHCFCGISVQGQKTVAGPEGEKFLKPGDRLAMWYSRTEVKLLRQPSGGAWEEMLSMTTTLNMSVRNPYFIVYPEGKAGLLYRFTEFSAGSLDAIGSCLWGALPAGTVYAKEQGNAPYNSSTYNEYEEHAGRSLGVVHYAQPWIEWNGYGEGGPPVDERGSFSMINMDGPEASGGKTGMERVLAGQFDAAMKTWAEAANTFGRPLFFRPWREMNGTWYSWGRDPNYIAAWRHMYNVITPIAPNVTFFWCPNTVFPEFEAESAELSKWYPGDGYVDWVGMDGYNYGTNPIQPASWLTPKEVFLPTYEILRTLAPSKPMMIGEVGCTEIGGNKAEWIKTFYETTLPTELPQVKAIVYFNNNVNDGAGEWDWQIESSEAAKNAFFAAIKNSYYVGAVSASAPSNQRIPVKYTVSGPDYPTRSVGGSRNQSETLTTSGVITRAASVTRKIAESLSTSDTPTLSHFLERAINESLAASDSVKRTVTVARSVNDSLSTSDSPGFASPTTFFRTVVQILSTTDALVRSYTGTRVPSEALTTSDLPSTGGTKSSNVSETLSTSDSPTRSMAANRALAETLTTLDTVKRATGAKRAVSEALSASEAPSRLISALRSVSQTLTTSDVPSHAGAILSRAVAETLAASDAVARLYHGARTQAEALSTSDTPTRSTQPKRAVTESHTASDAPTRQVAAKRATAETVHGSDAVLVQKTFLKSITETLTTTDVAKRTLGSFGRNVAESHVLSETVSRVFHGFRSILDTVTGQDSPHYKIHTTYRAERQVELSWAEPTYEAEGNEDYELIHVQGESTAYASTENSVRLNIVNEEIRVNRPNDTVRVRKLYAPEEVTSAYDDKLSIDLKVDSTTVNRTT